MMSLYIDDFLIATKHQNSINWLKSHLKVEYNIKNLEKTKIFIRSIWPVT